MLRTAAVAACFAATISIADADELASRPVDHLTYSSVNFYMFFADGSLRFGNEFGGSCNAPSYSFDIIPATVISPTPLLAVDGSLGQSSSWMLFGWSDGSMSRVLVSTPSGAPPVQASDEIRVVTRCSDADLNWNQAVDFEDLTQLLTRWGPYDGEAADLVAVRFDQPPNSPAGGEVVYRFWSDGTREQFRFLNHPDAATDPILSCYTPSSFPAWAADVDGDGEVGFTDLVEVLSAWGPCP